MSATVATLPEPSSPLNPQALAQKYHLEREKRIREDGLTQYKEPTGNFARFQEDALVDEIIPREPITDSSEVLIIGGGYGGLLAAARLAQQGVTNFRILEKGGGFGGTWYWNQYPGLFPNNLTFLFHLYIIGWSLLTFNPQVLNVISNHTSTFHYSKNLVTSQPRNMLAPPKSTSTSKCSSHATTSKKRQSFKLKPNP